MEKLNKERYLRRVIVVCWIALAICFGIKLFGGNLFEIMCSNENFIKVCEYAENNFWAYYLLNGIYCFVSLHFLILAMIGRWKFTRNQFIVFISTLTVGLFVKSINPIISFIYDFWQGILMPIVFIGKDRKRIWFVFAGNALLIIFQMVSMFVKNIGIGILINNGLVVSWIFCVDVLIMILLYYFYSNLLKRKEED